MNWCSERFSVSSFNWTPDIRAARRSPRDVVTGIVDAGVATVLEIEDGQCFRSFPSLEPDEVGAMREALDARGASVSVLGINLDEFVSVTRRREPADQLSFLEPQLRAARDLCAGGVRLPLAQAGPGLLNRLLPLLHELDLVLYQEIQGPQSPYAPPYADAIDDLVARDDPRLRLVLDTSMAMPAVPVTYLERLRACGVPGDLVDRIDLEWPSPATTAAMRESLAQGRIPPPATALAMTLLVRFGRSEIADLAGILPLVGAVHLKFWDLVDDGGRVTRPLRDLAVALAEVGFAGTLCSEWGGHDWLAGRVDATNVTRQHLALARAAFDSTGEAPA